MRQTGEYETGDMVMGRVRCVLTCGVAARLLRERRECLRGGQVLVQEVIVWIVL